MMSDYHKERITRFTKDKDTMDAVRQSITQSFLKKRDHKDIYMAGAERVAIDLLEDAWNDLLKIRIEDGVDKGERKQVGL